MIPDHMIKEGYRRVEGQWLSKYELKYLYTGIALIFITPIQIGLFLGLGYTDPDFVLIHPAIFLLFFLVPPAIVRAITMRIVAGDSDFCISMMETLGITIIPFFTLHQGIMMICRIFFIYTVRIVKNDRHWRSNYPYIFFDPQQ